MSETPMSDPVADLEQRWAGDRSPQLTLQLAEEHRRLGNGRRALEVLREGLEHHPGHVAARVALGRYLLEDGDAAASMETLDSVLAEDPTHLVANKLLVRTALELGDAKTAQDRLDLYATLNEADPDIEALRRRLAEVDRGPGSPPVLEPESAGAGVMAADAAAGANVQSERSDEPFAGIWTVPETANYASSLEVEGIFDFSAAPDAAPADEFDAEPAEATATLGQLYLEQGHTAAAEQIFRDVLASDPENEEARQGLAEATGPAPDLLATDLVSSEALAGAASANDRRRLVLEAYRERLQAQRSGVE